jgi:flavodoxin
MYKTRIAFAAAMITGCLIASGGVSSAEDQPAESKTLILYYSRTGNTRAACEALQKELGADMQEIRDLNSRDKGFGMVAGMFKTILGMRTKIEPATVDFEPYDHIIISAPIWAGTFGLAMSTFVKRNSFEGKDVIIFITADSFMKEKPRQRHTKFVAASKGNVIGYFQVQAADRIDGDKVPRTQEKIVEETLKLVPDIKVCIQDSN